MEIEDDEKIKMRFQAMRKNQNTESKELNNDKTRQQIK
jgi:hypothetical protein